MSLARAFDRNVGTEVQTKLRDRTRQAKGFSAMENLLMSFEFVFGCWHRNLSRPFTLSGWTYEVCLNCGKKFAYDRAEISRETSKRKIAAPPAASWREAQARVPSFQSFSKKE